MANRTCTQRLKVNHARVLRLTSTGTLATGPENRYESPAPSSFNYTPTAPDRERFEQLDGAGDQCALYIGTPKSVDSAEIAMTVCNTDAEQMELLAGGSIVDTATGGGDTIGYLSATDSTVNQWGSALEVWSLQWAGRQRGIINGAVGYYRTTFPKVNFTLGEVGNENGIGTLTYNGIAEVNSGFGVGMASDPWPVNMGSSVYGWFIDDAMPAATCGYAAVA